MNDDDRLLELELAQLQPRLTSPQLKTRLATRLASRPVERQRTFVGLAGGLAAGLALVVLAMVGTPRRPTVPSPVDQTEPSSLVAAFDVSSPSVWNYRRAAVDPAVELDELLDRHARSDRRQESGEVGSVFTFHQHSRMGDL